MMSDLKLFRIQNGQATEMVGGAAPLEKTLQRIMEANLEAFLGVRFLASEYSTGPKHGGRIDTLGIDENRSPVIIEYKRSVNENVINQGLFYLDWLMDHKAEYKLLVMDRLGKEDAESLDWSAPRLLCIAGDFTRYDEHAVQQMNRNIDLMRYRRFGEELLLLELVNAATATVTALGETENKGVSGTYKTITDTLAELEGELLDLYEELKAFLLALGSDVQPKTLKYYVAYKRLKNFACVEVHPGKSCITAFLKVDPDSIDIQPGYMRDVRKVGHYGTGDLELTLRSRDDFNRAKELFVKSYEVS